MTIIKADAGYFAILMMGDFKQWTVENTIKIPIIAWQFDTENKLKPRLIHDFYKNDPGFAIMTPDGSCHLLSYDNEMIVASSLDKFLELMKSRINDKRNEVLASIPSSGNA